MNVRTCMTVSEIVSPVPEGAGGSRGSVTAVPLSRVYTVGFTEANV